jgi:glycosyltransferase involved in cell wall biosynthesis
MKIVILNTSENKGGAAVACNRLHRALRAEGCNSNMLVRQKYSDDESVHEFSTSTITKKINLFIFFIELFFLKFFKKERKDFSLASFGPSLHKHPLILNADIIHIHWTQNSFLSLQTLKKIQSLGKPVMYTLHDMWSFTGGCHYNETCRKFEAGCAQCPQLKNQALIDIASKQFHRKSKAYNPSGVIICPSNWLATEAKASKLFHNKDIQVIPYNIDFDLFQKGNKQEAKSYFNLNPNKKVILFVSMNVEDERKGFQYLIKAIKQLESQNPDWTNTHEILAIGRHSEEKFFNTKITYTGRLDRFDLISKAYAAADVFVAPSVQDNLPNTVLESLACETPVVAFNIGGMTDMIQHEESGYLAKFGDHDDLAKGILFCFQKKDFRFEGNKEKYSSKRIVEEYVKVYKSQLNGI